MNHLLLPPEVAELHDLLLVMVSAVVDHPEEVAIGHSIDEGGYHAFDISVAVTDRGQAVGRDGKMAQSIRYVAKCAAAKRKLHIVVAVDGGARRTE